MSKHPPLSPPSSTSSSSDDDPRTPKSSPSSSPSTSASDPEGGWELGTETRVDARGNITCSASSKKKAGQGCSSALHSVMLGEYAECNYTCTPASEGEERPWGRRYTHFTPRTPAAGYGLGSLSPGFRGWMGEGRLDIQIQMGRVERRGREAVVEKEAEVKKRDTKRQKQDPKDNGGNKTTEGVGSSSQQTRPTPSNDNDDSDDDKDEDDYGWGS